METAKPVQYLQAQVVFFEQDREGKVTTNLVKMYGHKKSGLVVDDINFDGFDDIARIYGGPSNGVFLYKHKHKHKQKNLIKNDALTQLGSENLGLFLSHEP